MEAYAQALSYAIPGFIVLIIIEAIAGRVMGVQINRGMDVIASLTSGVTNTLKNLLGLSVVIVSYEWMEAQLGIFDIQETWLLYILAFIGYDFAGYWSHRFNHSINIFWNRHVVHHSSEEFNLSCALRQEMSAFIGIYFFLYIPMAVLGIPPKVVAIVGPVQLFAQFWYHTRLIGKMGFLEYIIVTPSHHRVHHAINRIYLDKNLSQLFIVWDKIFGTFQEELEEEPPVYGTLTPANSWNPVVINFSHAWRIAHDAWHTKRWWDKLRVWFMPLGWRPPDVAEKYPRPLLPIHDRTKYAPEASTGLHVWTWIQFLISQSLLYHMVVSFGWLGLQNITLYSAFLFASLFSYTLLMDRHPLAIPAEILRVCLGGLILATAGGWYGLNQYLPGATIAMVVYLATSLLMTMYFSYVEPANRQSVEPSV